MGPSISSLLAGAQVAVAVGICSACGARVGGVLLLCERYIPGQSDRAEMRGGNSPSPPPHKQIRIGCRTSWMLRDKGDHSAFSVTKGGMEEGRQQLTSIDHLIQHFPIFCLQS